MEGSESPNPKAVISEKELTDDLDLSKFLTKNTLKFFNLMKIDFNFVRMHPKIWENEKIYQEGKKRAREMLVVNDLAERGLAMFTNFNGKLTNQEDQKQFLLQVVEKHRKEFPDDRKSTLIKNYKK